MTIEYTFVKIMRKRINSQNSKNHFDLSKLKRMNEIVDEIESKEKDIDLLKTELSKFMLGLC